MPDLTLTPRKPGAAHPGAAKVIAAAKRSAFANRGTWAEDKVRDALKKWEQARCAREANRLLDTRAAMRIVKAAPADFEWYAAAGAQSLHGLIEVKSTQHDSRLAHDKVPQMPRLVHRAGTGGLCAVLVYHSTTKLWRAAPIEWLIANREGASWEMSGLKTYANPPHALHGWQPLVFTF